MRKEVGLIITFSLIITLLVFIFILINLFDRGSVVFTDLNQPAGPIVSQEDPHVGNLNPEIRLVLFSNFTCPTCEDFSRRVLRVIPDYDIILIWKNLPNDTLNSQSTNASIAALCAAEQNMFWSYHNQLMAKQGVLSENIYFDLANRLNLREASFRRCYERKQTESIIEDSIEEADRLGITGVPTLFIGDDRFAVGNVTEERLRERLELILSQ